ncbi:MAG: undecaprenyl-diphosphate phosphatase, partial [Victivallales bacterium]|nr:undecaprenyl-diphosphate phosphatase [Victivallales bacterium]
MHLAIKTLVLGIIQGLTEFLPISSTAHMLLVDRLLALPPAFRESFMILVQLGSILSVLVYFRKKLFPLSAVQSKEGFMQFFALWLKIAVGVIPVVLVGGLVGSRIKAYFSSQLSMAAALLIGGVLIILIESKERPCKYASVQAMPFKTALFIGLFQCLAIIPGASRSASTVIGALLLCTSRELAVEYSFYLAIPTMVAASAYSLLKDDISMSGQEWTATAVG